MKALRIGLCLLFAFSVLAFGAVEVWSESILEIGAAALFLLWALLAYRDTNAKIEWSPLNWPLLGFLGLGVPTAALSRDCVSVSHADGAAEAGRIFIDLFSDGAGI